MTNDERLKDIRNSVIRGELTSARDCLDDALDSLMSGDLSEALHIAEQAPKFIGPASQIASLDW